MRRRQPAATIKTSSNHPVSDVLQPPATASGALLRLSEGTPGGLRQLDPGRTLTAVAAGDSSRGQVRLQLAGEIVQARTEQAIRGGERLQVQVVRQDADATLLRVLPTDGTRDVSEATRAALARQTSPAPLLASVAALAGAGATTPAPGAGSPTPLPEAVQQAVRHLWQNLPDATRLGQADGVRQAVADSGLQLERRLAAVGSGEQPPTAVRGDFKGNLAGLLGQIFRALDSRPAPPAGGAPPPHPQGPPQPPPPAAATPLPVGDPLAELARQAEGSLARVQFNQLALLAGEALPLFFDLPVRDGREVDLLRWRLDREADPGNDGERAWRVLLGFHFRRLGPMHALLHLQGDAVGVTWWAEREATVRFLQRHTDTLEERLGGLGLRVGTITCAQGAPPVPESRPGGPHWRGLIDEQA